MSHAVQTTVLSLAGLRRLRFQTELCGERIPDEKRDAAETPPARSRGAGAGGHRYQRDNDFDLRSRSILVATQPLVFEVIGRDGGEPARFSLSRTEAAAL